MNENIQLRFGSSIEEITDINDSFSSGIIRICYTGVNRNRSEISKQSIERAMPTMFNCPVVCNYDIEADSIGGHDVGLIHTDDGETRLVNLTNAIGVIPANARVWWDIIEEDGVSHEYLMAEVILWKRSPAYYKISRDGITSQSMEISVKRGKRQDNGIFLIEDFTFTAFCLLGDGIEPCFESASLQMFDRNEVAQQLTAMMQEFKEEFKENFKKVNASFEVDIHPQKPMEGGEEHLEQKMELLTKFGLSVDQLDFDIEAMSVEELEAELNERFNNDNHPETPIDADPDGSGAENQFALTGEQLREELIDALCAERVKTDWGEMCRYVYCDYDSEVMEVFCYDVEEGWKLFGFGYSMNGDNVVIDFESKKRKKFSIVDFDEGDADLSYKAMFDVVVDASVSAKASELNAEFEATKTELEEKYNAASDTIRDMNNELEELRQYKQEQLDIKRTADEDAVFAMFADLNGIEAFEALKGDCSELSIEELEDKCFAIRGRNATQTFSAQKQKSTRLPIEKNKMADEPYGGLFVEFPPSR